VNKPVNKNGNVRILASHAGARAIRQELSRRHFLSLAALAGAGVALSACGSDGGGGASSAVEPGGGATGGPVEKSLSIYTWGDYDSPEVIDAFSKTGPKVTLDSYGSNEELISKLVAAEGTSGYDIVVPTGVYIPQLIENEIIVPLNKDLIPNMAKVDPKFLGQDWDPENEYSVCKCWGTTGFVYDTTVIKRDLATWNDFIDAMQNEASGKTSLLDDPQGVSGLYFWANDIDWNTEDMADYDAYEAEAVEKWAPHIAGFDSYPATGAMQQNTFALMQNWNGDSRLGILEHKQPDRWKWVLPGPTTELWMDNWCIPTGAPHPEAAHAFLDYVLDPENSFLEMDYIGYNTGALGIEEMAKERKVELPEMIFFTDEQLATMKNGAVNEAQDRRTEVYDKLKAAASA